MRLKVLLFVYFFFLFSCSFKPAYYVFVDGMDEAARKNVTIDKIGAFGKYKYITMIEDNDNGTAKYHFAKPNLWEGRHCHYYLVVEKESKKVIGWGFDYDKSDPKKNCGISG